MATKEKILVDRGVKTKLREEFKVSKATIQKALSEEPAQTALNQRIRERALQLGGVWYRIREF